VPAELGVLAAFVRIKDHENIDDNVSTKCVKKHSVLIVLSCPYPS
jgi:hypothetical protein